MEECKLSGLRCLVRYLKGFAEGTPYPVLLFLHGAGTRGEDMDVLRNNAFFTTTQQHTDLPFVTVAPLCTANTWFDLWEHLEDLVRHLAALPYVDATRFYVMGASMGGYATWQLGMSLPQYIAAIAPICGGGMYWNAGRLKNVPVWAFHGGQDTVVYPEESRKMVDAVNRNGGNAKLTLYPENGHNAWSDTYANPAVFAWLLQQRNGNSPAAEDAYQDAAVYG